MPMPVTGSTAVAVPVPGTEKTGGWRRYALALACVELAVLYAPTMQWLWERWTLSVWHNAHGLLIPPVVAYLVYDEMRARRDLPWGSSAWGFALLVPALTIHALDAGLNTQLLSAASLLLAIPGLALLAIGSARTRVIAFPLAFLIFALPIPLAFTEPIHWQLRLMVTEVVTRAVPLFGVPVFSEGTIVHTAAGTVQIAEACSGFSTLYASAAVAFLTAYTARSTSRRALVLLAAAPIAFVANGIRVVGLILLVAWQGMDVLDTFIHPLSGMLTFAMALPLIFWLGGPQAPAQPRPSEAGA